MIDGVQQFMQKPPVHNDVTALALVRDGEYQDAGLARLSSAAIAIALHGRDARLHIDFIVFSAPASRRRRFLWRQLICRNEDRFDVSGNSVQTLKRLFQYRTYNSHFIEQFLGARIVARLLPG